MKKSLFIALALSTTCLTIHTHAATPESEVLNNTQRLNLTGNMANVLKKIQGQEELIKEDEQNLKKLENELANLQTIIDSLVPRRVCTGSPPSTGGGSGGDGGGGIDLDGDGYADCCGSQIGNGVTTAPGGNGSPGSAGGGRVLCGELYRQGLLPRKIYAADVRHYMQHATPHAARAYHAWGDKAVELMQKSPLFTALVKPFVTSWAYEMAYRMGVHHKGNLLGFTMLKTLMPLHSFVGKILYPNTPHNYVSQRGYHVSYRDKYHVSWNFGDKYILLKAI